jgi:hypothetical protein
MAVRFLSSGCLPIRCFPFFAFSAFFSGPGADARVAFSEVGVFYPGQLQLAPLPLVVG